MKFRKTTKKETAEFIKIINVRDEKITAVGLIGYNMVSHMYSEYVKNFTPSLFRWKPRTLSDMTYRLMGGSTTVRIYNVKGEKWVSGTFYNPVYRTELLKKRHNVLLEEGFLEAINGSVGMQSTPSEKEKWISRTLAWGLEPYEFTTDTDIDYYEQILREDARMNDIIQKYGAQFGESYNANETTD